MKFLIDNALPAQLAVLLKTASHDAVHVCDYGMHAAEDEHILTRARQEDRIVISADTDFSRILATQKAAQPSFILFREPNLLVADDYFEILLRPLSILEPELLAGCVAVFRDGRLCVRKLPFFA